MPAVLIRVFSLPVSPGDTMKAEVFQIESNCTTECGQWETIVEDVTTGLQGVMVTNDGYGVTANGSFRFAAQHSTAGMSYAGGTTAEWVVEDPSWRGHKSLVPFANFGKVTFSDLTAGAASLNLDPKEGYAIESNRHVVLAAPSQTGSDGFTVSYTGP